MVGIKGKQNKKSFANLSRSSFSRLVGVEA